jgi:hypothetical protein
VQASTSGFPIPAAMRSWINVKNVFSKATGHRTRGMTDMLAHAGLRLEGRHHRCVFRGGGVLKVCPPGCMGTVVVDGRGPVPFPVIEVVWASERMLCVGGAVHGLCVPHGVAGWVCGWCVGGVERNVIPCPSRFGPAPACGSGLDDCRNIANVVCWLLKQGHGAKLQVTSRR